MPSPAVAHGEAASAVALRGGDDDVGAGRRVGQRVVDEDAQDLGHARRDRTWPRPGLRPSLSSRWESCRASAGSNSAATARDSSARSTGSGRSSSEPASSRERSRRSTASLRRRSTCSPSWATKRARSSSSSVVVLEQLDEAAEREDRRAQLVRRGGDERLARRLELGQLALHVVEGQGRGRRARRRRRPGSGGRSRRRRSPRPRARGGWTRRESARGDDEARQHARRGARAPPAARIRRRTTLTVALHVGERLARDDDRGDLAAWRNGRAASAHRPVAGRLGAGDGAARTRRPRAPMP